MFVNIVGVKNVFAQIGDRRKKWHVLTNIVIILSVSVILVNVKKEHKIVYANVVIEDFEVRLNKLDKLEKEK